MEAVLDVLVNKQRGTRAHHDPGAEAGGRDCPPFWDPRGNEDDGVALLDS